LFEIIEKIFLARCYVRRDKACLVSTDTAIKTQLLTRPATFIKNIYQGKYYKSVINVFLNLYLVFWPQMAKIHLSNNKALMRKLLILSCLTVFVLQHSFSQVEKAVPDYVQKWIQVNLQKAKNKTCLKDYNSPAFFSKDSAHIIGYLKGYSRKLGFSTGMIYTSNEITRKDNPFVMEIYKDGRFEVKIPMNYPKILGIDFKNEWVLPYIEPGQTLAIIVDWPNFASGKNANDYISYQGPAAQINTDLKSLGARIPNFSESEKDITTLSPSDFSIKQLKNWQEDSSKLEAQLNAKPFTTQAKTISRNILSEQTIISLYDFARNREYKKNDTANKILQIPVDSSFYSFIKKIDFNDKSLLIPDDFSSMINRFEYSEPFFPLTLKAVAGKGLLEKGINREKLRDSIVFQYYQMQSSSLLYQITKIRSLETMIDRLEVNAISDKEQYISYLKQSLVSLYLEKDVDIAYNGYVQKRSGAGYSLPDTKAAAIFKKIMAPHKEKIVFVDFWATTCGPCVSGIKNKIDTRKKYAGNPDFDFVFITSENESPIDDYKKFVAEQNLVNTYCLNIDDYRYLRELFKFNGIPKYVVVGKEGNILNDEFQMFDFESELSKRLPKYAANK
jgi:thiol-disulfide isomerase/thioredoxin